jgi:hypothetical protein
LEKILSDLDDLIRSPDFTLRSVAACLGVLDEQMESVTTEVAFKTSTTFSPRETQKTAETTRLIWQRTKDLLDEIAVALDHVPEEDLDTSSVASSRRHRP